MLICTLTIRSSVLLYINGRRHVCCGEWYFVSNAYRCALLCTLGVLSFMGELGFLNCDDICKCVVNKQSELPEIAFDSVHVGLAV